MKRKTGRRKDQIWQHVVETDGGFICSYCQIFYSGGASRIKAHLSGKSGSGISPCPNVHSSVAEQVVAENCFNVTSNTRERPVGQQRIHGISALPPVLTSLCVGSDVEKDSLLAKFLILNNISLETVDKPYFRNFLCAIASSGPNYVPPTYPSLVAYSLPILEKEVEHYIQNVRESWSITGCTVKIHLKEKKISNFFEQPDIMGYTVYSPKGVIFFNAYDPSYSSTSQSSLPQLLYVTEKAMKKEALQILYDVEQEKDSHDNLLLYAGTILHSEKKFYKSCAHICAPTEILKLLRLMCSKSKWLLDLLTDAEYAYEYLSTAESDCLMMGMKEKPGEASINEHPFLKLQKLMQCKTKLQSTFINPSEITVISNIVNRENFWQQVEEVLDAIGPLVQLLNVFDSFVPNIGYFYGAIEEAEENIDYYYAIEPSKYEYLRESFRNIKGFIVMPMHIAAAYLNPAYMFYETIEADKIEMAMDYMNDHLVESEKEAFKIQLEIYTPKDPSLFTDTAISELETCHPVTWWNKFGLPVPVLRKCAIPLLSQPSNCISHLQHKDKFDGSDMLTMNAEMMEEFKLLGETILKPIDLSKINAPIY